MADNFNLGTSKTAKIQPLYDILNNNLMQFRCFSKQLCIDKSMVPYFGGHSAKMFIHGKPIRFSYNLWSLCGSNDYPYNLIICNGRDDTKSGHVGLGEHVTKSLVSVVDKPEQHELYFDNFLPPMNLCLS